MIRPYLRWAALLALAAAWNGAAQPSDADFRMDIQLNFGGDYPRDAWIPVDVLVFNDAADYEGYVEVRAYRGDDLQSPIYQVPASSPRNSSKRFRLYGRFGDADKVETNFIHRDRPVLPVYPFLRVQPTNPNDRYALLLTEAPEDYGFLNLALPERPGGEPPRLYRKRLDTTMLSLLPEHVACYTHYDIIVIDDVESSRIGSEAQARLAEYVRLGGVLVVMTGSRANLHGGGWLETLAGVQIGPQQPMAETVFAGAFADPGGLDPNRQIAVAALEPVAEEVRAIRSGESVLSTLRPLGQGAVVTFAVDAELRGLQDAPAYRALWRDLFAHDHAAFEPDTRNAANWLIQNLPAIAGVTFFSKGAVLTYLLLYIGVAIVGNWLVCNFIFRRREWAWGFLVLFSFGFTAYALVYGTAGRAQSSEASRVTIVRLNEGAAEGEYASLYSLLTSRTQVYALGFEDPLTLAADQAQFDLMSNEGGVYSATPSQPFRFTFGPEPAVENLRIGASELRLIRTEGVAAFDGAITGSVQGMAGAMTGELRNETGHVIRRATILHNGERHECAVDGDVIRPMYKPIANRQLHWQYRNMEGLGGPEIDQGIEAAVINAESGRPATEAPVLFAWIETHPIPDVIVRNAEVPLKHDLALLVVDLPWRPGDSDGRVRIPLAHIGGGGPPKPMGQTTDAYQPLTVAYHRMPIQGNRSAVVTLLIPDSLFARQGADIGIDAAAFPAELTPAIQIQRIDHTENTESLPIEYDASKESISAVDADWRGRMQTDSVTLRSFIDTASRGQSAIDSYAGTLRYRLSVPPGKEAFHIDVRAYGAAPASSFETVVEEFSAWH